MITLRPLAPAALLLALLAGEGTARAEAIRLPDVPTSNLPPGVTSRHLVYLNRHGGTYAASAVNDSRLNLSYVPFAEADEAVIPPFELGDEAWGEVLRCVRAVYAPFDIEVVEEDPGLVPHLEAVIGGTQEDAGYTAKPAGGVAPMSPVCDVVENGIAFTFSKTWEGNLDGICSTTVHEIGHLLGLDHSLTCEDAMSYCHDTGQRLVDVTAACGEEQEAPRPCSCSATQNSVEHLETKVGLASAPDRTAPVVRVAGPASPVGLYGSAALEIETDDDVRKLEILRDGEPYLVLGAQPWMVSVTLYDEGLRTLTVRATDGAGNVGEGQATVEVRASDAFLSGGGEGSSGCALAGAGPRGRQSGLWAALAALGVLAGRRRQKAG